MRCRTCDYPLWNLPSRQCPECGTPFLPSTYEFKVGAVQFKCPHCEQSYYGTDERGHLEPRAFDCVSCGRAIEMDSMLLLPAEGVEDDQTHRRDPVAWLVRRKIGFFRGWIKTVFAGMGAPGKLAVALPPTSPKGQAWWFAALTLMLSVLVASVPFGALMMMGGGMSGSRLLPNIVGVMLFGAGAQIAWLIAWGLTVHVALRIFGVSHATLGRTFEILCYCCGPSVVVMIPCVGPYVSWIGHLWWMIGAAVALRAGYGTRGWKTALAAGVLPVLATIGLVALILMGLNAFGRAVSSSATVPTTTGPAHVATVLLGHGSAFTNVQNTHAAELVASGELTASELIAPQSQSSGTSVRIGELSLDEFLALEQDQRDAAASAASAALPPKVVAHRVGDVVFTYHGLDADDPRHQSLWAFIVWPDPEVNHGPPAEATVGLMNGTTMSASAAAFPAMLLQQNTERAAAGLTPLPDPGQVTHKAPGTSE